MGSRVVVEGKKSGLNWGRVVGVGLLTVGMAVAANLLVRVLLFALLDLPDDFRSLQPGSIALFTTAGVTLGVVAFAIVARMSRRPVRTYSLVAVIAFIVSIVPNLVLAANPTAAPFPGGTTTAFLTLIVFHVVAAVIAIFSLTRLALE